MTDTNPDTVETPIEVRASPVKDQAATGARDIVLLVAALPALVAVLGTRDVKQIIDWLASEPGLTAIVALGAIVTPIWRQWLARRTHAKQVTLADTSPLGMVKK